jgi:hypothetical protein
VANEKTEPIERNLGVQPLQAEMEKRSLKSADLIEASSESLTYKMISRAKKGRRLTPHIKVRITNAFNKASGEEVKPKDLFNY